MSDLAILTEAEEWIMLHYNTYHSMGASDGAPKCVRSLGCIKKCPVEAITQQAATFTLATCWDLSTLSVASLPKHIQVLRDSKEEVRWTPAALQKGSALKEQQISNSPWKTLLSGTPGTVTTKLEVIHTKQSNLKNIRAIMKLIPILYLSLALSFNQTMIKSGGSIGW